MKKNCRISVLLATVAVLAGCGKAELPGMSGRLVKEIAVTNEEVDGVKSFFNKNTRQMSWTAGDKYFYYTYDNAPAVTTVSNVTSGTLVSPDARKATIPVTYTYGENTVVMGSMGTKVGAVSGKTKTTVTLTDGIPAVQDGTVESSYVSIGTADLITAEEDPVTFKSCQTYISFQLNSGTVGGKTVKFFTVESKNTADKIAGNVSYDVTTCKGTVTGTGTKIIVNVTAAELTEYFVAVPPITYTSGIRITLYDAGTISGSTISGGHICGWADTKTGIAPASGKVLALGDLTAHKTVPASTDASSIKIHPSSVNIVRVSDYTQVKKLYVEYNPTDMTDIEFSTNNSNVTVTRASDEEYNNGTTTRKYFVLKVQAASALTAAATTRSTVITVKDKYPRAGTTAASATCTVTVGMFVDLGLPSKTLWAVTNMKGKDTDTWNLSPNLKDYGDMYAWGWVTPHPVLAYNSHWTINDWANNWTGTTKPTYTISGSLTAQSNPLKIKLTGGRYYTETKLNTNDDVARKVSGAGMVSPVKADFDELMNSSYCKFSPAFVFNGSTYIGFTSLRPYYEDVTLYFRLAGEVLSSGKVGGSDIQCFYITGELNPDLCGGTVNFWQAWLSYLRECYHCMCYGLLYNNTITNVAVYTGGSIKPVKHP